MKAVLLLIGFVVASVHFAEAQQSKLPRIGFVGTASASALASRLNAFRQGLRELDYIEGKNIAIEYRVVEGNPERLDEIAAELVSEKVDVIVTHGEVAIRAFKRATTSIPIVVGVTGDLVVSGHAASLARPGGNITGLVDTSPELSGKRLEIIKDVLPQASRIAVLWNRANPVKVLDFKETEMAAHGYGLKLQSLEVRVREDFEKRLQSASAQRYVALVVLHDALTTANAKKIVDFANSSRLPAMYGSTEFVEVGGLMSYAANFPDLFRRAATYVDKILKGTNPGDLPVEQSTKFELVINLKTANQIGLAIPPSVLARADRVIR